MFASIGFVMPEVREGNSEDCLGDDRPLKLEESYGRDVSLVVMLRKMPGFECGRLLESSLASYN